MALTDGPGPAIGGPATGGVAAPVHRRIATRRPGRAPGGAFRQATPRRAEQARRTLGVAVTLGPQRRRERRAEGRSSEVATALAAGTPPPDTGGQATAAPAEARAALEVLQTRGAVGPRPAPETDGGRSQAARTVRGRFAVVVAATGGKTEAAGLEVRADHPRRTVGSDLAVLPTAPRGAKSAPTLLAVQAGGVLGLGAGRATRGAGDVMDTGRGLGAAGGAVRATLTQRAVAALAGLGRLAGIPHRPGPPGQAERCVARRQAEAPHAAVFGTSAGPFTQGERRVGHTVPVVGTAVGLDIGDTGDGAAPPATDARGAVRADVTRRFQGAGPRRRADTTHVERHADLPRGTLRAGEAVLKAPTAGALPRGAIGGVRAGLAGGARAPADAEAGPRGQRHAQLAVRAVGRRRTPGRAKAPGAPRDADLALAAGRVGHAAQAAKAVEAEAVGTLRRFGAGRAWGLERPGVPLGRRGGRI